MLLGAAGSTIASTGQTVNVVTRSEQVLSFIPPGDQNKTSACDLLLV